MRCPPNDEKRMYVTLTSILLRSPWQFFTLSNHGRKIFGQTQKAKGFVKMKNSGWWKLHFTMSAWDSAEAIKDFARSGAHLEAMKQSAKLSTQIRIYTYETENLPSWDEAKLLLEEKGKVLNFPA